MKNKYGTHEEVLAHMKKSCTHEEVLAHEKIGDEESETEMLD